MRLILRAILPVTCLGTRYERIAFLLLVRRLCRMFCERLKILPVPVILKRRATPLRVRCLIFFMISSPQIYLFFSRHQLSN